MIQEMYRDLVKCASGLGDFASMTKTELANGYCDADEAHDEIKRSQYYAAVMLKYWYMVPYLAKNNKALNFELDEFASWLAEALNVAFKYRRWRDKSNKLSEDPSGPEKVINMCITSTVKRWYAHFNKDKRKINYNHDVYSLDESFEVFGDGADAYIQHSPEIDGAGPSYDIVQMYLNNGKIIDALIIDGIAHYDSFKAIPVIEVEEQEDGVVEHDLVINEFNKRMLVKHLNALDKTYLEYFESIYSVDSGKLQEVVSKIGKISSAKLYNYIDNTLSDMKKNKEVISILCS